MIKIKKRNKQKSLSTIFKKHEYNMDWDSENSAYNEKDTGNNKGKCFLKMVECVFFIETKFENNRLLLDVFEFSLIEFHMFIGLV